jgi:UDP-N-acetylglucosamine 4,6-dehydratase
MTRFWITLEQGVDFVKESFNRMHGGEIFVPKLPSVRIVDLAKAMAPDIPTRVIGIRPGEKLHEIMCPSDDSHLTVEFKNHYVIRPAITFWGDMDNNYESDCTGESGKPVHEDFVYSSGSNPEFLSVDEIQAMNTSVDA